MPSIPTRNPLIERSNMVVLLTLYYKRKSINHVSWGTVIGCFAFLKRSKEADGVLNIEDAYSMRVYLVGFPKQLNYVILAHLKYLQAETYKLKCVGHFGSTLHRQALVPG